ncbi:MAG: hypothetical protein NW215_15375 [Hyphomicrobiales bacterium]|nr:hypothetical protein [Hyphomicrobiales bacterium]
MQAGRHGVLSGLALFSSLGTLVCCALPALFVALGAGATLASLVSAAPQLVWLSEHKAGLFVFAGAMLAASSLAMISKDSACPANSRLASACRRQKAINGAVLGISAAIYAVGFFFAFIAAHVL